MRNSVTICSCIALLQFSVMLQNCTRRPEAGEEAKADVPPVSDPRGFDPLELPRDREIVPAEYPQKGDIVGRRVPVDSKLSHLAQDSVLPDYEGFAQVIDTLNRQAFRVQIFTSKLYGEAREAAGVAEEIFDQPLFIDYDVPNFKLRVGNFENRDKAESYRQKVRAVGYTNAWVVMVNVGVKEAAPLYDDLIDVLPPERLVPEDTVVNEDGED